jgi:aspartokinase-like uncharacterized kinase
VVDTVVKVGGGLLARDSDLDDVLTEIGAAACRGTALLIVPGGGPFADAVRDVDRRIGLADDAAHWMAVLAMDQYAHLIASRLESGRVVAARDDIAAARALAHIPVLAPSAWLRAVDPLPHSWDATSDSIAAWVAGQLGAARLVLVKPAGTDVARGAPPSSIVDPCFADTLPPGVAAMVVAADRLDDLRRSLA